MLRRDFFKAISAAAAAIAAGSTALARPKQTVAVSADAIRKPKASLPPPPQDPIPYVKSLLKECRVIGHDLTMTAGELTRCRVMYRHDPKGRRSAEDLRWEEYLADAKMLSVNVTTHADEIDVTHLGTMRTFALEPARDVEIEYVIYPKRVPQ